MGRPKGQGKTPGSGRQKGTKNNYLGDIYNLAEKIQCNPLEVLLRFCKGDWEGLGYSDEHFLVEKPDGDGSSDIKQLPVIKPEFRLAAAKEACKYYFAQKKAVEHSTSEDGFKIIVEDYTSKK